MTKWINVNKKLPKIHTSVLVCNIKGSCQDERDPFIGAFDELGWFEPWKDPDCSEGVECEVTHWMPIPKEPSK